MPKCHITDEMVEVYGMDKGIYFATLDGSVYVNAILSAPKPKQREYLAFAYLDYLFRGNIPSNVPKSIMGFWLNLKQSADMVRQGKATGGTRKAKADRSEEGTGTSPASFEMYPAPVLDAMRASGYEV